MSKKKPREIRKASSAETPLDRRNLFKYLLSVLVLVISTVIVYYPSLKVPFLLDDYAKIVGNPDIKVQTNLTSRLVYPYRTADGYRNDPSRPLTYLTLTLNYYFGQLEPYGYHVVNIMLHVLVVLLIFLLSIYLYPFVGIGGISSPFLSALIFAVHPINVNVVTYVIGRATSLAALFYLCSVILFIRARRGNKGAVVSSVICFILSLASNQLSLTLPAIICVTEYCFFSGVNIHTSLANWKKYVAYWIVLGIYLVLRLAYFGKLGDIEATILVARPMGYLLTECVVIWKYVGLMLVPIGLSFEHLYAPLQHANDPRLLAALALPLIMFFVIRRRLNPSRHSIIFILFGWLWFLITILPTSSFLPTTATLAENRVYLPAIGLCLIFPYLASTIVRRLVSERHHKLILLVFFGLYSASLAFMTFQRNALYQNPIRIWMDVVQHYPDHERAHKNLSLAYSNAGKLNEAVEESQKALALDPEDTDARNNLAALFYSLKRYKESLTVFQEVVSKRPDYAVGYSNMGIVYEELNNTDAAINAYQAALRLNPSLVAAMNNLAGVYLAKGSVREASLLYEAALKIDPNNTQILKNYQSTLAAHK